LSYSVRHQIFVSSTFTDLVEERAEVIQALWELDCIPTGMEAFVASNEDQWSLIKRVIDECDYYVLIIGGRYGSVNSEGVSYTEKEYRYAKKIGLPILAFIHADPETIASKKTEKDTSLRLKLEEFRTDVMKEYPVRKWSSPTELGGLVSRSLVREIKINPRPGWIRNDGSSPVALLQQISDLNSENSALKENIESMEISINRSDLSNGTDKYQIRGFYDPKVNGKTQVDRRWEAFASWDDIFKDIGPMLLNEASEKEIEDAIIRFHGWAKIPKDEIDFNHAIQPEVLNEILVQFRALGFIDKGKRKRATSDKSRYWSITIAGETHLLQLLAIRKQRNN